MNVFLLGMLSMAAAGCSVFFLRFFRQTRDRLFLLLSLAFVMLAVNWGLVGLLNPQAETRHFFFVPRLIAFALIVAAVIDKNRRNDAA